MVQIRNGCDAGAERGLWPDTRTHTSTYVVPNPKPTHFITGQGRTAHVHFTTSHTNPSGRSLPLDRQRRIRLEGFLANATTIHEFDQQYCPNRGLPI